MIRKVKGLPTTADITGMVSWQNQFDIGVSIRTNSSMALMSVISLGVFDIGYAYETPTDNGLSQLNLRTHEISSENQSRSEGDQTSIKQGRRVQIIKPYVKSNLFRFQS